MNPKCCGLDAVWTVQSPTLQYWFCKECKKEVSANAGNSSALTNPDAAFEDLAKEFERIMQTKDSAEDDGVLYSKAQMWNGVLVSPTQLEYIKKLEAEFQFFTKKEVKNMSFKILIYI